MRTTLTLEDDIAAKLQIEMRRRGVSLKQIVNETLRTGLTSRNEMAKAEPFKVKARAMGQHAGLNYDNIADLLDQVEGPGHR